MRSACSRTLLAGYRLPRPDEDLLRYILGISGIANSIVNMPVNPVYVHVIQLPEGIAIASYGSVHQTIDYL